MKSLYDAIRVRLLRSLDYQRDNLHMQASNRSEQAFNTAAYIDMLNECLRAFDEEYEKIRKE